MKTGESFNAQSYLTNLSTTEGSADISNVQITSTVDTSTPGTYYVYYRYPHNGAVGIAVLTVVVQ
jgi:predicted Zn-dependent protease